MTLILDILNFFPHFIFNILTKYILIKNLVFKIKIVKISFEIIKLFTCFFWFVIFLSIISYVTS